MKRILISFIIIGFSLTSYAQYNTGDAQLNASLSKIDANAQLDFGAFKADLSASYNVSTNTIDNWSIDLGMKAGDIYLALELAKITKKPADEVVKVYQKDKGKGWGVIAKELGIKPGSPEFHALKNNATGKSEKAHGGKGKGNPHSKKK